MSQYKNTTAGFETLRKRIITKLIPVLLLALISGLAITYFQKDNNRSGPLTWIFIIVVLAAIMCYALIKAIKRQKEIYYSYQLTIGADYLTRQQHGLSAITLNFTEITQISADKYGNLLIKGQKNGQRIAVSVSLENYEEVKNLLQSVIPISEGKLDKLLQKYSLLSPLVAVALMVTVYLSNNKAVVATTGVILLGLMIWSFYKIRTSPQVDSGIKRKSLWILVVIISIILIVYNKVIVS